MCGAHKLKLKSRNPVICSATPAGLNLWGVQQRIPEQQKLFCNHAFGAFWFYEFPHLGPHHIVGYWQLATKSWYDEGPNPTKHLFGNTNKFQSSNTKILSRALEVDAGAKDFNQVYLFWSRPKTSFPMVCICSSNSIVTRGLLLCRSTHVWSPQVETEIAQPCNLFSSSGRPAFVRSSAANARTATLLCKYVSGTFWFYKFSPLGTLIKLLATNCLQRKADRMTPQPY